MSFKDYTFLKIATTLCNSNLVYICVEFLKNTLSAYFYQPKVNEKDSQAERDDVARGHK